LEWKKKERKKERNKQTKKKKERKNNPVTKVTVLNVLYTKRFL
jgi:hypothetical protein